MDRSLWWPQWKAALSPEVALVLLQGEADQSAQYHVMVQVMAIVLDHNVQEHALVVCQELIRLGRHLMVPTILQVRKY